MAPGVVVNRQGRKCVLRQLPAGLIDGDGDGAAVDVFAKRVGRDSGGLGVLVGAVFRQDGIAPELPVEAEEAAGINLWQRLLVDALLRRVHGDVDGRLVRPVSGVGEAVRRVQVGLLEGVRGVDHAGRVAGECVAILFPGKERVGRSALA